MVELYHRPSCEEPYTGDVCEICHTWGQQPYRAPYEYWIRHCICGRLMDDHAWGQHPHLPHRKSDGILITCNGYAEKLDESFEA